MHFTEDPLDQAKIRAISWFSIAGSSNLVRGPNLARHLFQWITFYLSSQVLLHRCITCIVTRAPHLDRPPFSWVRCFWCFEILDHSWGKKRKELCIVILNKVVHIMYLILNTVMSVCWYVICSCFCTEIAKLNSCNRDLMAFKAKNICHLALYKKMFATNPCFIGYCITLHTLYRMQVCSDRETLRLD